ncbi:MAG: SprT-like domain-containing protein [Nitrosopumilus sp.]|nr:SprT-like domain-containing protein [Nitrosopumilus sp.]
MKTKPYQNPTEETYFELQSAFDFFNDKLFNPKLPPCLITLQRHGRYNGYFSPSRFKHRHENKNTDEIAINPDYISQVDVTEALSTLVHEMVHLQQNHFGSPSRSGYHNKQWGAMMESIGLIPSDTGEPGGKKTGQSMSHYIATNGLFEQTCGQLVKRGFTLSWGDTFGKQEKQTHLGRIKYRCSLCKLNAWAKPAVTLVCGKCNEMLLVEEL